MHWMGGIGASGLETMGPKRPWHKLIVLEMYRWMERVAGGNGPLEGTRRWRKIVSLEERCRWRKKVSLEEKSVAGGKKCRWRKMCRWRKGGAGGHVSSSGAECQSAQLDVTARFGMMPRLSNCVPPSSSRQSAV